MLIHIDRPSGFFIHNLSQEIIGWIANTNEIDLKRIKFTIDEMPMEVALLERADVKKQHPNFSAQGWALKLRKSFILNGNNRFFSLKISLDDNLLYKKTFYKSSVLMSDSKDSPIFFMHIPKTAGTALRQLIDYVFSEIPRLYIYGDYPGITTERAYNLSKKFIQSREIIFGHYGFNFRDISETRNPKFVTILRNPIEIIHSYLNFQLQPNARFLDNPLVRHFSGIGYDLPFGKITKEHLNIAIEHAHIYFYVLHMEQLQQFSDQLTGAFGLNRFEIPSMNGRKSTGASEAIARQCFNIQYDQILFDALSSQRMDFFEFMNS